MSDLWNAILLWGNTFIPERMPINRFGKTAIYKFNIENTYIFFYKIKWVHILFKLIIQVHVHNTCNHRGFSGFFFNLGTFNHKLHLRENLALRERYDGAKSVSPIH